MARASWNNYFMDIAKMVSERSTCDRNHVGSVIVKNRTILSTGYNGSIAGTPHCDDEGHLMENGHCVRTVHSEANAIIQAAKNGVNINNSSIYCTSMPCWNCFKLIANSGIKKIFFGMDYRPDNKILEHARILGLELVSLGS